MKKLFSILLLAFCLTLIPFSTQARTPELNFGCVTIFMGGEVDGNCIIKHWQVYCGGSTVINFDTIECY